ncbi:hypothetical protein Tco_1512497 [Tanacetum coccineum]
MFKFKIRKLEESSSNWKPWHNDWDATTSNHLEEDAMNDDGKYRYNRKGFLEDDESSDDSILIVDPGWDDYSLQALKSNRPIPLCPEARRARIPDYQFGYPQGKSKIFNRGYGEYYNSQWTLPPAWIKSGVMLVLPTDPGLWSEVISRLESITINRLNNQTWSDNKAKLAFVDGMIIVYKR